MFCPVVGWPMQKTAFGFEPPFIHLIRLMPRACRTREVSVLSVLYEESNDLHVVQTRYELLKMNPALYFKCKDMNRSQCHEPRFCENRDLTEKREVYTFDTQINHSLTESLDITE